MEAPSKSSTPRSPTPPIGNLEGIAKPFPAQDEVLGLSLSVKRVDIQTEDEGMVLGGMHCSSPAYDIRRRCLIRCAIRVQGAGGTSEGNGARHQSDLCPQAVSICHNDIEQPLIRSVIGGVLFEKLALKFVLRLSPRSVQLTVLKS